MSIAWHEMGALRFSRLSFGEDKLHVSHVDSEEIPYITGRKIIGGSSPCIFFHVSICSRKLNKYNAEFNQPAVERERSTEFCEEDASTGVLILATVDRIPQTQTVSLASGHGEAQLLHNFFRADTEQR